MGEAELVVRRWSWPGPGGKPVYNYRSDGREFGNRPNGGRCLIVADGFYEFTTPVVAPGAPKPKRKDKWLFTSKHGELFAIAGVWRANVANGQDAWTMLTCEPGPDIAPYHDRQVVVLDPERWSAWLSGASEAELLVPSPKGSITVKHATEQL